MTSEVVESAWANIRCVLYQLDSDIRRLVRRLERLHLIIQKKNNQSTICNLTCLYIYIYIYIYTHTHTSLSSSCRAISTDIPGPLSPPLPIIHRFQQVLKTTPCNLTELLYVCLRWSTCFFSAMWRGPDEYITYVLVPTSPAVSCKSGSSNLDSSRDGC